MMPYYCGGVGGMRWMIGADHPAWVGEDSIVGTMTTLQEVGGHDGVRSVVPTTHHHLHHEHLHDIHMCTAHKGNSKDCAR